MHGLKTVVYLCKLIPMRDILVDLHFLLQVVWQRKKVSDLLSIGVYGGL